MRSASAMRCATASAVAWSASSKRRCGCDATSVSAPSTFSPERSGTASSAERPSVWRSSNCSSSSSAASRTISVVTLSIRTGAPVRITPGTGPSSSTWTGWRVRSRWATATLAGLQMRDRREVQEPARPRQLDPAPVGEGGDRQLRDLLERGVEVVRRAEQPARLGEQPLAELGALDGRDVLGHVHRHRRKAVVVMQDRALGEQPALVAGRAVDPAREQRRRVGLARPRVHPAQIVLGQRAAVGVVDREALEHLRHRGRDQLLDRGRPHQTRRRGVGHHDPAIGVEHRDRVVERADERLELALRGQQPRVVEPDRQPPRENLQVAQVGARVLRRRARRDHDRAGPLPARAQREQHAGARTERRELALPEQLRLERERRRRPLADRRLERGVRAGDA